MVVRHLGSTILDPPSWISVFLEKYNLKQLSKGKKLRMYKRSIKLMFITQTNYSGSVIWKIEQHICQSKKVTNFSQPLPPKYSMLQHFDVIQKLVPSKDHFNNKKRKNKILKQKIHHFFNFFQNLCVRNWLPWQHD